MEDKKCLKLVHNSKITQIPVVFENLVKVKQEIAESLILKHEYFVKSKVNDEVFQSFVEMLVYQKEITLDKNNESFYKELNNEFELNSLNEKLKNYNNVSKVKDETKKENNEDQFYKTSEIMQILRNNEIKSNEAIGEISERLDDYLDLYTTEFIKIDPTILFQIFNDPRRKLKQHNKAYQLVTQHYEQTHNPEILKILPTLDYKKLDEFNQNDSKEYRHERHFFMPQIDANAILDQVEELERKIKTKEAIIDILIDHIQIEKLEQNKRIDPIISVLCQDDNLDELRDNLGIEIEIGMGCLYSYKINTENKTAMLFKVAASFDEFFVPREITHYDGNEYLVTSINYNAFLGKEVNSLKFDENSGIKKICECAFYDSTISSLSIPAALTKLSEGWCNSCQNLTKIEISPLNHNFKMVDDKLLFGKSDPKSDVFDVLLFACRDIEKVDIPSYVKKIDSFAFDCCSNLHSINIPENSELQSIGKSSFYETKIESFYFPSKLCELKPLWCDSTKNLTKIEISPLNHNFIMVDDKLLLGKSDQKSDIYNVILFARRDIEKVDIPPYIKKISSSAFDNCDSLNAVNIPENSDLRIIGDFSFCETKINQINIPSNVVEIGLSVFESCELLKKVNFPSNSKLRSIGNCCFDGTSIGSFIIPQHVSYIGDLAFYNNNYLQIIEISENSKLKFINKRAFKADSDSIILIMIPTNLKNKISF